MSRLWRACGGLVLALVVAVCFAPPAAATYSDDPTGPTGWVPDGPVEAVVASGGRVFVGGGFSGGVAALDASTGALLWKADADAPVRALAVSADGTHVVVGGAFNSIGGATHRKLASLRVADGAVEPGWRAGATGVVRDIVVLGDVAYFGGHFQKHDGLAQRGLGAVLVSTGKAVPAFDAATDANVHALATDGQRLFVGGRFTLIDGQARNMLASVDLGTYALDPWLPPRVCTGCNLYWDVLVDNGTVYTAGRNYGAVTAFSATTGARGWRVAANGDGQALALADGTLYAGGHFTEIGPDPKQPRSILAALDPATGGLDPDFQPRFVGSYPGIWALSATSDRLYVGGYFSAAGTFSTKRYPYFAMFE
jgi:outer membrane protein assembly factor BamB